MGERRIKSDHLRGIVIDADHHRYDAPATSTGFMVHVGEPYPEDEVDNWFMEFDCATCGEMFQVSDPKYYDLMRWALSENGIEPKGSGSDTEQGGSIRPGDGG